MPSSNYWSKILLYKKQILNSMDKENSQLKTNFHY